MTPAFTLARWFTPRQDISGSGPEEFLREELLGDLYDPARLVATRLDANKGEQIIVLTARQTCMVEHNISHGAPLIVFDSVANDKWEHVGFWFNQSSVQDLVDTLRKEARHEQGAFDLLFCGTRPQ